MFALYFGGGGEGDGMSAAAAPGGNAFGWVGAIGHSTAEGMGLPAWTVGADDVPSDPADGRIPDFSMGCTDGASMPPGDFLPASACCCAGLAQSF